MTVASLKWSRSGGAMSLLGAMTFPAHPTGEATTTTTPRVSSRPRQLHVNEEETAERQLRQPEEA